MQMRDKSILVKTACIKVVYLERGGVINEKEASYLERRRQR